jgi:hypothetical protein
MAFHIYLHLLSIYLHCIVILLLIFLLSFTLSEQCFLTISLSLVSHTVLFQGRLNWIIGWWVDGWIDGWWMDGWVDKSKLTSPMCIYICTHACTQICVHVYTHTNTHTHTHTHCVHRHRYQQSLWKNYHLQGYLSLWTLVISEGKISLCKHETFPNSA